MMRVAILACLALGVCASDVTPIQKVIEMMDGMLAKGKKEKHEEEVEFAKFHEWCDQVRDEKTNSIAEAIAELEKEVAKLTADADSATALRKKENGDYKAAHQ